jgi:uncharacterized protein (TIGR02265 family)
MKTKREILAGKAAVKGTMLQAHLEWAHRSLGDVGRLASHLQGECAGLLTRQTLSTHWVPFRCLIQIDRAIAAAVGGPHDRVFRDLGRHSASTNLGGVYKRFVTAEPHRVFTQMSVLHSQFQNFGKWQYVKSGDRSGKITLLGYPEYSPVYCTSAAGYFEEALKLMHAPGPILVKETSCQCAGEQQCVFEVSW